MIKITVLYGHPADADAFENYYAETHLPLTAKVQGIEKTEMIKFLSSVDGSKPAWYRMAELYFSSPEAMQQTMGTPEGKVMADDLQNFAAGGLTIIVGHVES